MDDGCGGPEVSTNRSHVTRLIVTATVMSLEAARNLSIPDLLRVLNEKLGLECARLRETPLPPVVSAASLESEVSRINPHNLNKCSSQI